MARFLILKSIFKIKIHLFFYVFLFVCLITGNIRDYLVFTSIIIVHELGHIFSGMFFSWKVEEIIVLPFGCLTVFHQMINTSLLEQFIVTLCGPLFQIVFYFVLSYFFPLSNNVVYYNLVLLIFNLIPIYPLDGSKFLYIFLCLLIPFKFCHLLLIFVSFVFVFFIILFVGRFDLIIFLILFFLVVKNIKEFMNHDMIFNRFLFERYLYDLYFDKVKVVDSHKKMYLWCRHVFFLSNKYITEKDYLLKRFDNHSNL